MTSATLSDLRRPTGTRHPTAALLLLASIVVTLLAASAAPTPLYATYAAEWHFSPITTTVVFGTYALAVLVSLLLLGRISDHLGRRPVLLVSLGIAVVAMIVFLTAGSVPALLVARAVQGVATGAAIGAVGAGMLDLHKERGALANSVAPGVGTAVGVVGSAAVVQFLPFPTHLIYLLLIAAYLAQAVGVLLLRETVTRAPGALRSLRPELSLPRATRGAVAVAAPVLFAVWSLVGFYGALAPGIVAGMAHSHAPLLGGLGLFLAAAVGTIPVLALRTVPARTVLYLGTIGLLAGIALVVGSVSAGSAVGFFVGTAIAGLGFGAGFQGGIRTVVPLAAPHERAGVLSLLYIVCYLGMGGPAVLGGILAVRLGSLPAAARDYGIGVLVLGALALAGLLLRRPRRPALVTERPHGRPGADCPQALADPVRQ
jgi:MFS family permease